MKTKLKLILLSFLEFAVWGSYLTSMGSYLNSIDLGSFIGYFYSGQGFVSLFMPALIGIIADKWISAEKVLGYCHILAAAFMLGAFWYCFSVEAGGGTPQFALLYTLYMLSIAFYMPTIALSNSVSYYALNSAGLDTVKDFPSIRIFGTIGFICSMVCVDFAGLQSTSWQFFVCGALGMLMGAYSFTLPKVPVTKSTKSTKLVDIFGLRAFALFSQKKMAIFFIFSMLLGAALQVTNGYANVFIGSFAEIPAYADTFGAKHANVLISLSQCSETLCILLIPFFMKRLGIKVVMVISMLAWVLRFGLFGIGDPGSGVWLFVLSMLVYGVAFDFFNISGSLFVEKEADESIKSSAQGLFMMMTNGFGATLGTLAAMAVINSYVYSQQTIEAKMAGWSTSWLIFAGYSLVIAIVFALVFKYKHNPKDA